MQSYDEWAERDYSGSFTQTGTRFKKPFYSARNEEAWRGAVSKQEALLIGYFIAGDPTASKSCEIIPESIRAGIDVIELGIPGKNPHLDGEIIKRGHQRVTASASRDEAWLLYCFDQIQQMTNSPIWAMGYHQELVATGLYLRLSEQGLVDGLLLPDCTLAVQRKIQEEVAAFGVDVIRFVHNAMSNEELAMVCDQSTIVYAQTYNGVTGDPFAQLQDLSTLRQRVGAFTSALTVAGFGLRTPERVRMAVENRFDGAVVGSVLVNRCERGEWDYLYRLIAEMKAQTKLS